MIALTFPLVPNMQAEQLWSIGIRLPGTLTLVAALWGTLLGIHALVPRQGYTGEQARILKLIGISLAEPALNIVLIPQLLLRLTGLWPMPWFYALAVTLPMSLLVVPAMYASFRDPLYRKYQRVLLGLGAARWAVGWGIFTAFLSTKEFRPVPLLALALLTLLALLLIGGVAWGHAVLVGPLRYPRNPSAELERRPRDERWRDL